MIFHDSEEIVPISEGFPASWGNSVYTIGNNIENHGDPCREFFTWVAPPEEEGMGAKHSPPGQYGEIIDKIIFINIENIDRGSSGITPEHLW